MIATMNEVVASSAGGDFAYACDPAKLAAIGETVRTHLARVPEARRQPTDLAEVYVIDRFLTGQDCRRIVQVINSKAVPSTLYKGNHDKLYRTSSTHHFDVGNAYTHDLELYICEVTGLDILQAEAMQGQRYGKNQEYKHHHDFFHLGDSYWPGEAVRGGQRTWTAMINLNEPREGGETDFPHLGMRFKPKTGQLVLWNNMTPDGRPNMKTLHAGMPVIRGMKHVITLWFRQDPWRLLNG